MTHADYTSHTHALLIRRLIGLAGYVDISIDQDELLRTAFLPAFRAQVMADRANMACVQFQKHMIIDEKRELVAQSKKGISARSAAYQLDPEVMIAQAMAINYAIGAADDWRKVCVPHLKHTLNEARCRIQFVTDTGAQEPRRYRLDVVGRITRPSEGPPADAGGIILRNAIPGTA